MASTNKTSHYNLSQYVGSDKPTYLVDYNTDMSAIDTGIYNAQSKADTNETSIGTLSSLNTSTKTNLVGAINEVNTEATSNTSHIGNLSNLTTTANTDLVSAINEVDAEADSNTTKIGTLVNLETTNKTNLVGAINETFEKFDMFNLSTTNTCTVSASSGGIENPNVYCSLNSDSSIFKIYGGFTAYGFTAYGSLKITISNTGLTNVSQEYTIAGGCCNYRNDANFDVRDLTIKTNGDIEINISNVSNTTTRRFYLPPCIYFNTNFGNTPTPNA